MSAQQQRYSTISTVLARLHNSVDTTRAGTGRVGAVPAVPFLLLTAAARGRLGLTPPPRMSTSLPRRRSFVNGASP